MSTPDVETLPRTAALVAGWSYLLLFVLAIFANFVVLTPVVDAGDPAATVAAVAESETLFRLGLLAFLVVFIADVVIAWALYVVFRGADRDLSLLAAWFRLVYTVFLGVALIALFLVLRLVSGPGVAPDGRDAQVVLLLDAFTYGWLIGLVCFGIHLVLLARLVQQTPSAPTVLAVLLVLAGAAYVVDTVANAVLPNYADLATVFLVLVAVPSVVAELWFAAWLLLRGGTTASDGPNAGGVATRHRVDA